MMILDVTSSGAGSAPDRAYAAAVARAQAAGIKVLGYASTGYARRPTAAVEADVRHYRAWYHVNGIFLDEAATGAGELSYYQKLTGYIRHTDPGAVVMLNPGTYPSRRYMALGEWCWPTREATPAIPASGCPPGWTGIRPTGSPTWCMPLLARAWPRRSGWPCDGTLATCT